MLSEELIDFVHAISGDEQLRKWLLDWHELPLNARTTALGSIATEMRANREDPRMIAALTALMRPAIYDAVYKTLIEVHGPPA